MIRIYVLVEGAGGEPFAEGRYEFASVPRVGECITIGSLDKDATFRVIGVINHAVREGDRAQPLEHIELRCEVLK
jgi:hypothetical protein